MEFRKHFSMMNARELDVINTAIHNTNKYIVSKHCKKRIAEKQINMDGIIKAIQHGKIIEYHYLDNSNRILLRSKEQYNNNHICVVIDIKSHEVITAYLNKTDDNHKTLFNFVYAGKYNILQYMS